MPATCTNSAILSAIARLPSIECSLREATYLSKRSVPSGSELASSFNWYCGSQNLVVSVALSLSVVHLYQSSHSVQHILARVVLCGKGVFDITSRIPWTMNQEQDI